MLTWEISWAQSIKYYQKISRKCRKIAPIQNELLIGELKQIKARKCHHLFEKKLYLEHIFICVI